MAEIASRGGTARPMMIKKKPISVLAGLCAVVVVGLGLATNVAAAVIYNEAVSGDLPGDQASPTFVGTLGLGVNTILGTHHLVEGTSQGDTFRVDLPGTLQITGINVDISNANMGGATSDARFFRASPFLTLADFQFTGNASHSFNGSLPVPSPGSYGFSVQFETAQGNPSYDWIWTIQTQAVVPEPTTLILLASGLVGVGGAAWRKRRRG